MPLKAGKKNIGSNIKMEVAKGHPYKQALAIALSTAKVKKSKKKKAKK